MTAAHLRLALLVAAMVCAAVFTVIAFGWLWDDATHYSGWLGLAVLFGFGSLLPK